MNINKKIIIFYININVYNSESRLIILHDIAS